MLSASRLFRIVARRVHRGRYFAECFKIANADVHRVDGSIDGNTTDGGIFNGDVSTSPSRDSVLSARLGDEGRQKDDVMSGRRAGFVMEVRLDRIPREPKSSIYGSKIDP